MACGASFCLCIDTVFNKKGQPMTLTSLAQKHNLDPESAEAFLREWFDSQTVIAYGVESMGNPDTETAMFYTHSKVGANHRVQLLEDGGWLDVKVIPLIARTTDLGE